MVYLIDIKLVQNRLAFDIVLIKTVIPYIRSVFKYFLPLLFLCLICCNTSNEPLLIATAANMQAPMQELMAKFEETRKIDCELSVASSGKLATQIKNGAPFDVFVSADTVYPGQLFSENLIVNNPQVYGYGMLCLCDTEVNEGLAFTYEHLSMANKIAVANPDIAPYGKAAVEALEKVYPDYRDKLLYGESIGQTALFVRSGAATLGILSKSMKQAIEEKGGKCVSIKTSLYNPIAQAVGVIKGSKQQKAALEFQKFLLSNQGKEILDKFGYSQ